MLMRAALNVQFTQVYALFNLSCVRRQQLALGYCRKWKHASSAYLPTESYIGIYTCIIACIICKTMNQYKFCFSPTYHQTTVTVTCDIHVTTHLCTFSYTETSEKTSMLVTVQWKVIRGTVLPKVKGVSLP